MSSTPSAAWGRYASDAVQLARAYDCPGSYVGSLQQRPTLIHARINERVCNWYMPVFDRPSYGGLMTCFRLATAMASRGVRQRFIVCGPCDIDQISVKVAELFPSLQDAEFIALDSAAAMAAIPFADYSIATLWTTAYILLGVTNTALKFYMIQDMEPLFYPAGSTYGQAELTYRFGFIGIANTESIADIYRKDYGGTTLVLVPQIDPAVFHPIGRTALNSPRRIFYYARPDIPRNCFELAAVALKRVKERMGDGVEIVLAGAEFDQREYGLNPKDFAALGMLPYARTADLYRSCHAGLALMMTKHPSYLPLELMACGAIAVTNRNPANQWWLRDRENCITAWPTAECLADALQDAVTNFDSHSTIRGNALNTVAAMSNWQEQLSRVVDGMLYFQSAH